MVNPLETSTFQSKVAESDAYSARNAYAALLGVTSLSLLLSACAGVAVPEVSGVGVVPAKEEPKVISGGEPAPTPVSSETVTTPAPVTYSVYQPSAEGVTTITAEQQPFVNMARAFTATEANAQLALFERNDQNGKVTLGHAAQMLNYSGVDTTKLDDTQIMELRAQIGLPSPELISRLKIGDQEIFIKRVFVNTTDESTSKETQRLFLFASLDGGKSWGQMVLPDGDNTQFGQVGEGSGAGAVATGVKQNYLAIDPANPPKFDGMLILNPAAGAEGDKAGMYAAAMFLSKNGDQVNLNLITNGETATGTLPDDFIFKAGTLSEATQTVDVLQDPAISSGATEAPTPQVIPTVPAPVVEGTVEPPSNAEASFLSFKESKIFSTVLDNISRKYNVELEGSTFSIKPKTIGSKEYYIAILENQALALYVPSFVLIDGEWQELGLSLAEEKIGTTVDSSDPSSVTAEYWRKATNLGDVITLTGAFSERWWNADKWVTKIFKSGKQLRINNMFYHYDAFPDSGAIDFLGQRTDKVLKAILEGRSEAQQEMGDKYTQQPFQIVLAGEPFFEYGNQVIWQTKNFDEQGNEAGKYLLYKELGEDWPIEAEVILLEKAALQGLKIGIDFEVIGLNLPGIELPGTKTEYTINTVNRIKQRVYDRLSENAKKTLGINKWEEVPFDIGIEFHLGGKGIGSRDEALPIENFNMDAINRNMEDIKARTGSKVTITELDGIGDNEALIRAYAELFMSSSFDGVNLFEPLKPVSGPDDSWQNILFNSKQEPTRAYYELMRLLYGY